MDPVTLGIDLASQAKGTAICALEWGAGSALVRMLSVGTYEGTPLHDKFLVTTIAGLRNIDKNAIVKAGIGAPFGWPEEFVDALNDHHSGGGWPSGMDNPRDLFYWRETDVWVRQSSGKTPLSVRTDKIAFVAMRCAVLLEDLGHKCGTQAVDRTGTGLICEVYPDPALRRWTAEHDRSLGRRETYKRKAGAPRRRELLAILREKISFDDPSCLLDCCVEHDHALDALTAALVARAVSLNLTDPPSASERIQREGWIHLPNAPLEALVGHN
jgi:hypothetical protein